MRDWLFAFCFTQVVEVPIYLRATDGRWGIAFLASALTHPIVWFVFPAVMPDAWGYWPMVAAAEVFAVGAEALWLRRFGVRRALMWSFLANASSAVCGLLMRAMFGVP